MWLRSLSLVGAVASVLAGEALSPAASRLDACSVTCDREAGDCVDQCEERYREDKPRVECKLKCIEARHRCEDQCRGPAKAP